MPNSGMERRELTFHPYVKLLGYLCVELADIPGDVLEIGVWKGRSVALMQRMSPAGTTLIGVDPCVHPGQEIELRNFCDALFPDVRLVIASSEQAAADVLAISRAFRLIHIDGGHLRWNVWADFLLYAPFVVPGGCIVFDDYADDVHSPEVRPAIDDMHRLGLFHGFEVIGPVPGYVNSFLLRRLSA
jgi:predicted O-methyltransferase YrrM